jgi:hypothetical protein
MRLLTGAGTPRQFRTAAVMLFAFLEPDRGLIFVVFAANRNQSAAFAAQAEPRPCQLKTGLLNWLLRKVP